MSTVLITGANRGIGLELTRQLAARGDHVIATCRATSPELEQCKARIETGVDVTSDASVRSLRDRLGATTIDCLIHNAGILSHESLDDLDFDRIRAQFEINTLGPLRLTHALLDRMARGSKIAILTSRMGSIADNSSGSYYGYRISKAAVNIVGVSLACDLRNRGIAVGLLHPGFVRTDMTRGMGNIDADEAAAQLIERIDHLSLGTSGSFWHANGEGLPW